ncbi:MAG TPA: hypothetical protein VM141_12440 [Planctomycetota bacterium]|nr:hypothetical protein [Planctomycetota bacterium]
MKQLPTLYKITSFGALQEWSVYVEGNRYWTCHGQTGGTIQRSASTVCTGKNAGRANATTGCQQAELEAAALHTKKLKKDYTLDPNVKAGQKSELIAGGVLPMLAHKFSDHGDKLKYPCFVQPKLDGHRCIGMVPGDTGGLEDLCPVGLWSRTRKNIASMSHIATALDRVFRRGDIVDGELYNHEYRDKFEQLTHFIRQSESKTGCEIVQYHVYDLPSDGGDDCVSGGATFRERYETLCDLFVENPKGSPLKLVETREVANEDELMLAFEDFLAQGYEGAIARNADGLYVNKRSYDLLKIKKFDDGEFTCIRVEEGKGKMAGHAVFVCQLPGSYEEFKAKMKGDHAELAKYFKHPELVIGKEVTVKYQGLTGKNKVPRFPVALRIRETE